MKNVQQGLKLAKDGNVAIHVNEGILNAAFKADRNLDQRVSIVEKYPMIWDNIILRKNSPLRPMFHDLTTRLREDGVIWRFKFKWEGPGFPENKESDAMVRGQTPFACKELTKSFSHETFSGTVIGAYASRQCDYFIFYVSLLFNLRF